MILCSTLENGFSFLVMAPLGTIFSWQLPCCSISVSLFKTSLTGILLDLWFREDAQVADEAKITFFICTFLKLSLLFSFSRYRYWNSNICFFLVFFISGILCWSTTIHPTLYFKFTGSLRKQRSSYKFIDIWCHALLALIIFPNSCLS